MKKAYLKLGVIGSAIAGLIAGSSVFAGELFDLPAEAVSSTTAYIGNLFSDLAPFIFLAIGIPLAFYVIRKVISMVAGRAR